MRVRFLPATFDELLAKDKVTFFYYYDQVSSGEILQLTIVFSTTQLTIGFSTYN